MNNLNPITQSLLKIRVLAADARVATFSQREKLVNQLIRELDSVNLFDLNNFNNKIKAYVNGMIAAPLAQRADLFRSINGEIVKLCQSLLETEYLEKYNIVLETPSSQYFVSACCLLNAELWGVANDMELTSSRFATDNDMKYQKQMEAEIYLI